MHNQKIVFWIIVLLGVIIFAFFIIPNNTGAADAAMLSAFEHDEFAQYPNVIHMLQSGETLKQTLHNFLVYSHYYYGYPFYFFSALTILPIKLVLGADWSTHTQTIVTVLRQLINVLPMLLAVFLLVRAQLRSKSPWKALLTFLLILTLPAVVSNNLWWHPDSLLTLFAVLTILFLVQDDGKLGKYFYLSGFACALAIGAKILGVLFVLTYAAYLFYGFFVHKNTLKKTILSGLLFLVVLIGSVIVTNPLLLLPIERGEIIAIFKANLAQSSQGFWVADNGTTDKLGQIIKVIRDYYGGLLLCMAALVTAIAGLFKKDSQLKALVILTWVIGYMGYFVLFAATLRPHYFIPALLPLYTTLLDWVPDHLKSIFTKTSTKTNLLKALASLVLVLGIVTITGFNSWKYASTLPQAASREKNSASLAMFRTFQSDILPSLPADTPLIIYRDWRAYVADNPHWRVIYNWNLATYDYIEENQPDFLFIEFENAYYFADESKLANALDPLVMQQMYDFYSDVLHDKVIGYHLLYKDTFGYIFVSDGLFEKYY